MDSRLKLEITAECWQLLLGYVRHLDDGNGEGVAALFAEDGVWDRAGKTIRGRDQIRATVLNRPKNLVMRNIVTNLVVDPTDENHASGRAYYFYYRDETSGLGPNDLPRHVAGPAFVGDYMTNFVRTPEGWRIAHHKANRIFEHEKHQ
jgi:hypothetical protein